MSQLGAYEAGLTDDPGCWVQPIEVYWTPRLDPRSPEYDPELAAQVAWEERGSPEARERAEPPAPHAEPGEDAHRDPEPGLEAEP